MTMSWVAEAKATTTAKATMVVSPALGPVSAMATRPAAMTSWASSIQPRRRPNRPSRGTSTRSTIGDQKGLKT